MSALIYVGAECAYCLVKILLCFRFLDLFFERKRGKGFLYVSAGCWVIVNALNCIYISRVFSNTLLLLIVLTQAVLACWLYRGGAAKLFAFTVFYFLFLQLLDLLATTLLYLAVGEAIVRQGVGRALFLLVGIGLLAGLFRLARGRGKSLRGCVSAVWLGVFDAIGVPALIYFQKIYLEKISRQMAAAWGVFLLYLVFMFLILAFYIFWQQSRQREALIKTNNLMLRKSYGQLMSVYEKNARVFHDFRAHIRAIQHYLQEQQVEECVRYLEQMTGPLREIQNRVWTGNRMIDLVLSSKSMEAEERGAAMEIEADMVGETRIPDMDLCVIFSNLLDNAIENCGGDRRIQVSVRKRNHILIAEIRNAMRLAPRRDGGDLATWKEDKTLHGIGLESVRAAAEKNQGSFTYRVTGQVFEATVLLSL